MVIYQSHGSFGYDAKMALGWASWGVGTFLATLEGWHVVTSPGWAVAERDEVQKRVWETRRTVMDGKLQIITFPHLPVPDIFGTRGLVT